MREVITNYFLSENAVDETNGKITTFPDYESFKELRDYEAKRDISVYKLKQSDKDLYNDLKSYVIEHVNVDWI